jgi:hypothetical protein
MGPLEAFGYIGRILDPMVGLVGLSSLKRGFSGPKDVTWVPWGLRWTLGILWVN